MTVETVGPLGSTVGSHRQAELPNYLTGTFVINDSDAHDFKVDARGKGRMSVVVDNPGDQTLTVEVYGMHSIGADVDDVGVVQIGSSFTVTDADEIGYETVNDPFPFYLIRVTSAGAATASPTCTVYVDLSAF